MGIKTSHLPFFVIMSDIREVGLEHVEQRVNANNIIELVARTVEIHDSEEEEQPFDDLQCGQQFTYTDYSSDDNNDTQCYPTTVITPQKLKTLQPVCLDRTEQQPSTSGVKKRSKPSVKSGIRSLKKQKLLTDQQASDLMTTKPLLKGQKTLHEMPLTPDDDTATFATKLRSLMMNITLLQILQALQPPLRLAEMDEILETFATSTLTLAKQESTVLRTFLQALVDLLLTSHGETYFTDLAHVYTDPTWSTIRCGITVMKNVILSFDSLRPKTANASYLQTQDYSRACTSSSITQSTASNTYTSSTIARGTVENVAAPGSISTKDSTPIESLLALAKCRLQTGSASSHIYVQDADASYKYELTSRPGDTLLDLRVYPLEKTMTEEPMNWWRFSSFRGQIVVNSGSNNFSRAPDQVFQRLQELIAEIQTLFANAEETQITRQRSRR